MENITKAELACPGSSCFHVILANGELSAYLYCFDSNCMQVVDSGKGVVYKAPSFDKGLESNMRNINLQHFSNSLLLDAQPNMKLLYYQKDSFLYDFDEIYSKYFLTKNSFFSMLPDPPVDKSSISSIDTYL